MAKEAVKYNNEMNKVRFKGWKSRELNIFYSICAKMRDKGTDEVVLSFDEIIKLANLEGSNLTLEEQVSLFDEIYDKLLALSFGDEDEDIRFRFNLFSDFTRSKSKKDIRISINKKYEHILNQLKNNFTRFELLEFNEISGEYPKLLYRHLKQWKTTGKWEVQLNEFRRLFDIPEWYQMTHIDARVLKNSIKELKKIKDFENLRVTKIKKGRNIDKLVFEYSQWVKPEVKGDPNMANVKKNSNKQKTIIKYTDYNDQVKPTPPKERFISMFNMSKRFKFSKYPVNEETFEMMIQDALETVDLSREELAPEIQELRGTYFQTKEINEEQLSLFDNRA